MEATTIFTIGALRKGLEEIINEGSPDLSLRQLNVLLTVGSSAFPLTQQQLVDMTGEYKSTVSKIVAALSGSTGDVKRAGGLGLLNVDLDPADLRSRVITLTKDGEKLLTRVVKIINRGR